MENLAYMLIPFQEPELFLMIAVGVFFGVYIGAIPGLSSTMAISLLVSFTFGWSTNAALAIMLGIHCGVVYGGSRSAILLNIPGAPAAVATGFDGYPLAKKGMAGQALGITCIASVIGGYLGTIALAIGAPLISNIALKCAPRDYLLLAFMGLMLVGSLGTKSITRGIISAVIGVTIGMVGMDPISGQGRYTFGNVYLMAGIDYVPAMLGLFGVSEVLEQLMDRDLPAIKQKLDRIIPSVSTVVKHMPLILRSSVIGVLVGAMPGAGGDISALIAYDQAKRTTKNPEVPFGEGAIEGIIAPETANNATIGGVFIPMLTLGIPGDAVSAVMIGALTIHGLKPGPMLMSDTPHLFYLMVMALLIANFFLIIFGLTGIRIFAKLVEIPKGILFPIIVILTVVGSYAINNSLYDIFWMIGFGILGYFLKRFDYPTAPAVLGIILAELIETNFRRAIIIEGTIPSLLLSFVTNPISLVLLLIIVIMFVTQSQKYKAFRAKRDEKKAAEKAQKKS